MGTFNLWINNDFHLYGTDHKRHNKCCIYILNLYSTSSADKIFFKSRSCIISHVESCHFSVTANECCMI